MFVYCASVRVSDGVNVGEVIEKTLAELTWSHKQCWLVCGIDGATWSRSMKGEAPIDLWKLRHLPREFWPVFLSKLASALIRTWFDDLCVPLRTAKAELRESVDEKRRA